VGGLIALGGEDAEPPGIEAERAAQIRAAGSGMSRVVDRRQAARAESARRRGECAAVACDADREIRRLRTRTSRLRAACVMLRGWSRARTLVRKVES
jgi:hypothetical protein